MHDMSEVSFCVFQPMNLARIVSGPLNPSEDRIDVAAAERSLRWNAKDCGTEILACDQWHSGGGFMHLLAHLRARDGTQVLLWTGNDGEVGVAEWPAGVTDVVDAFNATANADPATGELLVVASDGTPLRTAGAGVTQFLPHQQHAIDQVLDADRTVDEWTHGLGKGPSAAAGAVPPDGLCRAFDALQVAFGASSQARGPLEGAVRATIAWLRDRGHQLAAEAAWAGPPIGVDALRQELAGIADASAEQQAASIDVFGAEGEPLLRIEHVVERGDASVGMDGWSGWCLSEDQAGTALGALDVLTAQRLIRTLESTRPVPAPAIK
jgi:hypothetical protein